MSDAARRHYLLELSIPMIMLIVVFTLLSSLSGKQKPARLPATDTFAASADLSKEINEKKERLLHSEAILAALMSIANADVHVVIQPKQVETAPPNVSIRPGQLLQRAGDEICVCGQFFHTGTPVVLWLDPGGYDAYRTETRFSDFKNSDWEAARKVNTQLSSPNRYGLRQGLLTPDEIDRVRGGGWDLALLQSKVDQFVLHFDVAGLSRNCFRTLHDVRCLSVHFMLDIDGTIYQTLDLKERAWHATTSNTRSIGIEIANIGAYAPDKMEEFERWYKKDADGGVHIVIPGGGDGGVRTPNFVARPDRKDLIEGIVQGETKRQYDFTPQQYAALIKLTATLCKVFPKIKCDYPRDEIGQLIPHKLSDEQLKSYSGILGHYHVQKDKVDPGPALQWDRLIHEAKKLIEQ
ncbi:MAG TPA: peptidoglycan recognition family protein [Planctomycetota bacterium]|nr:peptidoglycan recognition family protein [Planctomycetota bacterium]